MGGLPGCGKRMMDHSHWKILGQRPQFYWEAGEVGVSVMMGFPKFVDAKVLIRKFLIVIILFNNNTSGLHTKSR